MDPSSSISTDMALIDAINSRRSIRGYLDKPVPEQLLRSIFEQAQQAPSNCNTQPWKVFVASGDLRDSIREKLINKVLSGEQATMDFDYNNTFEGEYRKRQIECAAAMYGEMGIERHDKEGRARAGLRNFELFDAPHVAFFCMEKQFGATIALDVGIYAQNLMLLLTAHGIGSCAMGSMRNYPDVVRKAFNIGDNMGVLFGMTFGYEDTSVPANKTVVGREPVDSVVNFKSIIAPSQETRSA